MRHWYNVLRSSWYRKATEGLKKKKPWLLLLCDWSWTWTCATCQTAILWTKFWHLFCGVYFVCCICVKNVFCILYFIFLYFVFCILYFVFCILYFTFCILYFVFCTLYFVLLYSKVNSVDDGMICAGVVEGGAVRFSTWVLILLTISLVLLLVMIRLEANLHCFHPEYRPIFNNTNICTNHEYTRHSAAERVRLFTKILQLMAIINW